MSLWFQEQRTATQTYQIPNTMAYFEMLRQVQSRQLRRWPGWDDEENSTETTPVATLSVALQSQDSRRRSRIYYKLLNERPTNSFTAFWTKFMTGRQQLAQKTLKDFLQARSAL